MPSRLILLNTLASVAFIALVVVRVRFDLARMRAGISRVSFRDIPVLESVIEGALGLVAIGLFTAGAFAEPLKDVVHDWPWSQWPLILVMSALLFQIVWEPLIRKRTNRIGNTRAGICVNGHDMLVRYRFCPVCGADATSEPKVRQPEA